MPALILASGSPRRKELLQHFHYSFSIQSTQTDENFADDLSAPQVVERLAERKAMAVAHEKANAVVIGADTVVAFQDTILEKPKDENEARHMMEMLSGQTHSVYTGVAIISPKGTSVFHERTAVTFYDLSPTEIKTYVQSTEPYDKAGGYGIQGLGAYFVERIDGDYLNVVGLPVSRLARELQKHEIYPPFHNPHDEHKE